MLSPPDSVGKDIIFLRSQSIHYKEWPLSPTDDLIRFRRLKVKVTAGHRDGEDIHIDAGASKSIF